MTIHFTKMHGIGNDYIYVDCTKNMLPDPAGVAIAMSPRHFSVGSDGLVLICPSEIADAATPFAVWENISMSIRWCQKNRWTLKRCPASNICV